jgi:rhodanese-related sulfurtransferase
MLLRMRRWSVLTAIALTIVVGFAARASAQSLRILIDDPPGPEKFKTIHADDLANSMEDPSSHVKVYDANLADTRQRFGVIDGAHLLSSYDQYNVAKELPADKNARVVFYCFDKRCMASHAAARRAIDAGYKDVSVMCDGIVGWRLMGAPIHQVTEAEAAGTE